MAHKYLLALHIIGFVSWFAALFYLVRLYIYHVEAKAKSPEEYRILHAQFQIMERRLWNGICQPAMIFTTVFGVWLLALNDWFWLKAGWIHLKLALMAGLYWYHFDLNRIRKALAAETYQGSSKFLRFWNEVATILLFAIVGAAVFKFISFDALFGHFLWFMGGFAVFAAVLGLFFRKALQGRRQGEV
jgi:putative membrane protein